MCPHDSDESACSSILSEDDFERLYEVLEDQDGSVLVDHHGAAAASLHNVWTVIEVDGNLFAAAGFHFVNRTGSHLLTRNPWETGYEVAQWSRDLERHEANSEEKSE